MRITFSILTVFLAATISWGQEPTSQPADVVNVDQRWLEARRELYSGNAPQAIVILEELSETSPNTIKVVRLLAQAYQKDRQKDKARGLFVKLGDLCMEQKRYASALDAWKTSRELGNVEPSLHLRNARAYFAMNQPLGKIRIQQFSKAEPGTIQGKMLVLDAVPKRLNQYWVAPPESAIFELALARQAGLELPEMDILEGQIWIAGKRADKAFALFKEIEKGVPKELQPDYYYQSAMAALELNDLKEFNRRLDKAVELKPEAYAEKQIDAWLEASERCNRKGDLEGYIRYLEQSVNRRADSADLYYQLGKAYLESDRPDETARVWQKVLELEPHHAARERVLAFLQKQG